MIWTRLLVLCAIGGFACSLWAGAADARGHPAADGYVFKRKEYVQLRLDVRIVEHANYRELKAAMPAGTQPFADDVKAWSAVSADGFCEIHIVDQKKAYAPEALGHELAHCIYGRWHR